MKNTELFERLKGDKSRVSKLGETAVIMKLTEMGWDAFNLNATNPNYKGVDIFAVNPNNLNDTRFIQVKASAEKEPNFPVGLVSDRKGNITEGWEKKFVGPWVFVHILLEGDDIKYNFYILQREEVIELIQDSNKWYWSQPERNAGKDNQPVGLPLSWITGIGLKSNTRTFRDYPRNIKIEKFFNNDGWDKIGTVK